jgi:hypothetical protein
MPCVVWRWLLEGEIHDFSDPISTFSKDKGIGNTETFIAVVVAVVAPPSGANGD